MELYQICLDEHILSQLREVQSRTKIDGDAVSLSEIINLCLEAGLNEILGQLKQNEAEELL
jgi:hypothetical protein